jgi:transposase-like protein
MPKKRFSAEQIVTLLRQIEVGMGQGKSTQIACREAGISEQSFYRWRKEYGGLDLECACKTPLAELIEVNSLLVAKS